MNSKKVSKFLRKNSILVFFAVCVLFVGAVILYRSVASKPRYVYAKIKLGQGLWWATTAKSAIWTVNAINKGDVSRDLFGSPQAVILSKEYYRWYLNDQFDVYLTVKLKADYNKKTGEYIFNRNSLSINSAIELQFPTTYISGTVFALSKEPFNEKYIEKTVYLNKRSAFPFEYDAIQIGDKYFDGDKTIFEVLDKSDIETTNMIPDGYGNSSPNITEPRRFITVKAKMLLKEVDGQLVLGEDQVIVPGKLFLLSTPTYQFENYYVSKVD